MPFSRWCSCVSISLLLLIQGINAQQGFIAGQTLEADLQSVLSFVHASVDGTPHGAVSGTDGTFVVGPLSPGHYNLLLSRIGYQTHRSDSIEVRPDDTAFVEFVLRPESVLADEIVVTATRKTQDIHLAPVSASVVTAAELSRREITTFDQALDQVPGVTVSRTSGASVQSLSIRGASETAGGGTGNRVLLLIDGRPAISPESGGALWNLVPLTSIERIEVVKGAYSALFGSSAMGGVINAITRKPTDDGRLRAEMSYGFFDRAPDYAMYDRFNDFHAMSLAYSRRRGKWSYLIDASRKHNDGHREKSGFELYNSYAKLKYSFAPNRSLQLSANFNRLHNDTPATWLSRSRPFSVAEHRLDDFQNKQEFSADLYYNAITSSRAKYSSRFYFYQNYSEYLFNDDPLNDSTNVNIGKQFVDRETIRASRLGNVTQVDFIPVNGHYAIAGIDVKADRTSALPDTVLYGKHDALHFGAFVQDEWSVSQNLTATFGARFDHYTIVDAFSENNFSPKVALVYRLDSGLAIRALFAQAFRNPAIAERFIKFEQGGGLRFEPNPTLRAEKLNVSTEIGLNGHLHPTLSFDIAGFYNHYRDLISFQQLSAPGEPLLFQVVNLKKAVMRGAEASFTYQPFSFLRASAGYTYLDARDVSPDRFNDVLAYKPRHSFSFAMHLNHASWALSVNGRGRSEIEEVFIYPGSEPGGYVLVDSKLSYAFDEGSKVYVAVNNINDTQYEELERYRMPGRSYTIGMTLGFSH